MPDAKPMTDAEIAELEALRAALAIEPWRLEDQEEGAISVEPNVLWLHDPEPDQRTALALLASVPRLLAEVRRLKAEKEKAEAALREHWQPSAIKWFSQLGDIARAASIGGDMYADLAGLCAWAVTLLTKGNACKPPMPVDWASAKRNAEAAAARQAGKDPSHA